MSTIYRGYDVSEERGVFVVRRDGEEVARAGTEDLALSWIDDKKRAERERETTHD